MKRTSGRNPALHAIHSIPCVPLAQAGKEVAGQGSENAVASPRSLGGGDSEPDEGICAICLDRTPVEEVALVKGCEHSYCGEPPLYPARCCPGARVSSACLPTGESLWCAQSHQHHLTSGGCLHVW